MATKVECWRDRLKQRGLYDSDAARWQRFARVKERLIAEQLITIDDDLVWVVPSGCGVDERRSGLVRVLMARSVRMAFSPPPISCGRQGLSAIFPRQIP